MQQQLKKANWLYFFAAWGLLAANVVTAIVAVFAPEFIMDQSLALSAVLEVLVVALPGAIFLSHSSGRVFCARFYPRTIGYSLIAVVPMAIGGFYFFTGLNAFVTTLVSQFGANVDNATASVILEADSLWMLFLSVALVPGIVEEFLLRGILLPAYAHKGKWPAILLSGFLFAFLHGQPIAFLMQFALGVLLGYLCWESRSVYPGMLYHAMHNAITIGIVQMAQWLEGDAQMAAQMESVTDMMGDTLVQMLPMYAVMVVIGGGILALCLVFFRMMCRQDRQMQARRGIFPDAVSQMPCGFEQTQAPRGAWLPLWLGLAASLVINVLGFVGQFFA